MKKAKSGRRNLINSGIRHRVGFGQNYMKDPATVKELIKIASLSRKDIVYEIGPGTGIITDQLRLVAKKVFAVEIDPNLVIKLRKRFKGRSNVLILHDDIKNVKIRENNFKVFSNPPFNRSAQILKRFLLGSENSAAVYLILQKETAEKYVGLPSETEISTLIKPWYDIKILKKLSKNDFVPRPSVDIVFLGAQKNREPFLSESEKLTYTLFIRYGYERWRSTLKKAYKNVFSNLQWKILSSKLNFDTNAKPTDLDVDQWLGLYNSFCSIVPKHKQRLIVR